MRDAFAVVAQIGLRFEKQRTGWRDAKALVVLVAEAGSWAPAADLADALGIPPDAQEVIYREVYGPDPPRLPSTTEEPTGRAIPDQPPMEESA